MPKLHTLVNKIQNTTKYKLCVAVCTSN